MENVLTSLPLSEIIGIVACLLGSAFFSGAETVLMRLPETRARQLTESQPERYGILTFWLETKKRILASLLVGNNLMNILCSVLTYRVALFFLPNHAEAISVFGLTIVLLIFAELTPKSLALYYAEKIVVPVLRLVWFVDKVLWIVTTPLSRIPELILRGSAVPMDGPLVTEDEIEYQIRLGHDQAVFEEKEHGELLISAVEFSEKAVKEVMIPRTDVCGLEAATPIPEAVDAVIGSGHSRIPVYQDNLDNIIGLLHAKDLLGQLKPNSGIQPLDIRQIARKPLLFAPETQRIHSLLAKMRSRGQHLAIVVDEFGGTAGLITLEDIIEELVGEIRDEFDLDEAPVRRIDDHRYIVDAKLSINDLKDATGIVLPDTGEYESVGGFVVSKHGHIPTTGTIVKTGDIQAKVLASDARHVEKIEIQFFPEESQTENE